MPVPEHQDTPSPAETPNGSSGAPGAPSDALASAWSQLKKQETDFERRSEVLDALRQRLTRHLDKQNRVILERQRALDTKRLQSERERQFIHDAKLHLRRTQKEEEIRHQRLENRARQLEDEEATVELARVEIERERQDHQRAHTSKLTTLIHQKEAAQHELSVMQQRPAAVPSRRMLSDWRLGVALLVGCVAAGMLFVRSNFDYEPWVQVSATSVRTTATDMDAHRRDLARGLAIEATDPDSALHGPTVHTVAEERQLIVRARSHTRAGADVALQRWVGAYLTRVETTRLHSIAATRREIDRLSAELTATESALEHLVGKIADQRLEIEVENPRAEWQKLNADVELARQRIASTRAASDAARQRLVVLENTAVPDHPEVASDTRAAAEKRDTQLHQDLEELRFHLNRLRNHLLDAFKEFPQQLERLAAATQNFSTLLETERVKMDDPAIAAHIEAIWQLARKLADRVLEFDYAWRKQNEALTRLSVDPRRDECQQVQRTVEKMVRDLNDDVNRLLGDIQTEHQKYLRSLDSRPQHFELSNGLRRGLESILEEQYAFTTLGGRVLPSGNLALDTIMHRVRGLSRRAHDRRQVIEDQLTGNERARLVSERDAALAAAADEVRHLDGERQAATDQLLRLLDRLNALTPYVEEHGVTDTMLQYTQEEADLLSAQVEELKGARRASEARLSALLAAEKPLAIAEAGIDRWPVNLFSRGLHITSTAIAATVLCFLLLASLARSGRPPSSTSAQATAGLLREADHGA